MQCSSIFCKYDDQGYEIDVQLESSRPPTSFVSNPAPNSAREVTSSPYSQSAQCSIDNSPVVGLTHDIPNSRSTQHSTIISPSTVDLTRDIARYCRSEST